MKTLRFIVFGLCIFFASAVNAQTQETNLEAITKDHIQTLSNKVQLNLTSDQRMKIFEVFLSREKQMEALKNKNLSKREKGLKIANIDIEFIDQLQKLLTESQLQKLISANTVIKVQ